MAVTMDNLVANGAKPGDFELDTRMLAAAGREVKATVYIGSMNRWNAYNLALAEFHSRYDLLLTPTVAQPPTEIGELDMPTPLRVASALAVRLGAAGKLMRLPVADGFVLRNLAKVPYTQLANITGRPAMSVPAYVTPEGLPLGVQFVGGLGSEGVLLSLATQIEGARPWDARLLAI
jgi:amidase